MEHLLSNIRNGTNYRYLPKEHHMTQPNIQIQVRNPVAGVYVFDIEGEINAQAESPLMDAYTRVNSQGARTIVLNFENLKYMNSSGIGLLVTLLIRVQRQKQHLQVCSLSDHYRQIFELTRLNEAIGIYASEAEALSATLSSAGG
jgi:anti-sigma B factor antagonist